MKQKIACIIISVLFFSIVIPATGYIVNYRSFSKSALYIDTIGDGSLEEPSSLGFGPWKIYGIFPSVSGNLITCILIGPLLGRATLNASRFNGHIGLFFIFGDYWWIVNGPPALPYNENYI